MATELRRMRTDDAAIELVDIHKRFGALEVLKGVSMAARNGDVVVLIGSSGSGKSTLLRCVNLLELPDSGTVRIAGEEIRFAADQRAPADWRQVNRIRRRLGMVFQNLNLWSHMTVLENIIEAPVHVLGVGRKDATHQARDLLAKVGIADKAEQYPIHLSGGQQQRAAIARALAMQPAALLLDEPTSALDPELVGDVLKVIQQLAEEGRTMVIVTHEMGFAREVASEILFLHEGRIEERGPPEQMFRTQNSERFRRFLRASV